MRKVIVVPEGDDLYSVSIVVYEKEYRIPETIRCVAKPDLEQKKAELRSKYYRVEDWEQDDIPIPASLPSQNQPSPI